MICIADKISMPCPSAQGVDCLLLDNSDDVRYLSARPPMGCVAYVLDSGDYYVSNSDGKWMHFNKNKEAIGSVSTAAERNDLSRGGDIKVKNLVVSSAASQEDETVITADTQVDFGQNTITLSPGFGTGSSTNYAAFYVSGGTTTLDGTTGGIYAQDLGTNDGPHCVIIENGATVEVNGGTYQGGATAFFVGEGTLIINGGIFGSWDKQAYGTVEAHHWTLNCRDEAYKEGKAHIVVRGGTFIDFDPSNPQTNDAASYVDTGYKVESKEENGHTYYTVVRA